ncbi:hypothetical protein PAPYR_5847 [Paratrimastix pyriformis]|uniref:Uncharacterized protein n=1 Tax=Paratrimastix pyriformis TaxID=342808 RepID=A0ABQ8UGS9_9EUKA|nr:hypothetical protein PAPYR_5847 [Paratrimastix pyriformis]
MRRTVSEDDGIGETTPLKFEEEIEEEHHREEEQINSLLEIGSRNNEQISEENVHRCWLEDWQAKLKAWKDQQSRRQQMIDHRRGRRMVIILGCYLILLTLIGLLFSMTGDGFVLSFTRVWTYLFYALIGLEYISVFVAFCFPTPCPPALSAPRDGEAEAQAGALTAIFVLTAYDKEGRLERTLRSITPDLGYGLYDLGQWLWVSMTWGMVEHWLLGYGQHGLEVADLGMTMVDLGMTWGVVDRGQHDLEYVWLHDLGYDL